MEPGESELRASRANGRASADTDAGRAWGRVASTQSTRLPTGHPEGYFEAFAQLYRDFAELVRARLEEREPDEMALFLPTCGDGLQGVQFIDAVLQSARNDSVWTELP